MNFRELEDTKMPIVFIGLSLVSSSICYGLYFDYRWLAVSSASLFFIFVFFYTNRIFTIVIGLFFMLGILININYYSVNIQTNFSGEIRIVEDKGYYKIGEYNGRRINLTGEFQGDFGERLYLSGSYKKNIDRERGLIGNLEVSESRKLDEDLISKIYGIRLKIYYKLKENLGQRRAALVSSVAFGYSDRLDIEDKEEMTNLGIIHAISVSGLHVSLIYTILSKIINGKFSVIATILYVILTGAPFSAIRSLIMIICLASSKGVNKNYNPIAGLALSAAIIVMIKPFAIFNIGFILSYLATLGIVVLSSKINNKLFKLPKYIRETISISIAAQIFTLPVMIVAFKGFSISFILGNILLLPILNLVVIAGNLLLPSLLIGEVFDFICYILVKIIDILDMIMEALYKFSSGSLIINGNIAFIYVFMIGSFYFIYKGHRKFILLPIAALIGTLIYIYSPILRIDYLREGGVLISYNGERAVVTNKRNIDIEKLKKANLAQKSFLEGDNLTIDRDILLKASGKNFILVMGGREYLLRLNNKGEVDEKYDIINFVEGKTKGFFIKNQNLLLY